MSCPGDLGLHETRKRHPIIRAAFPDLQTMIEHQIAEGDTAATRATLSGTHLGAFMGVAPTGEHLTWRRRNRALGRPAERVRDGLLQRHRTSLLPQRVEGGSGQTGASRCDLLLIQHTIGGKVVYHPYRLALCLGRAP